METQILDNRIRFIKFSDLDILEFREQTPNSQNKVF